jgi:hypothetical protein
VAVEAVNAAVRQAYDHYAAAGEEDMKLRAGYLSERRDASSSRFAGGRRATFSLFAKCSASNLQLTQDKLGARDRAHAIAEAMRQQHFFLKCASLL